MLAVQHHKGLLSEVVRAVSGIGRAFVTVFSREPAPYWTDYLRETDHRKD
jgi:hypothetical protein